MTNVLKSKIAKAGLGLLVAAGLAVASTAGAMTLAEAQALVAALGLTGANAQMVLALATPATTTTTTSGSCYQFTKTLAVGSTGADVTALQKALNMSSTTGYFGNMTKTAVMSYQTSNGLSAVGMVGPATRAKLNANCTSSTTTTTTGGTTTGTTTTGPVSVALATDNPASGSVVSPSTGSVFAKYVFTGNGAVTALKLMRTGISSNSSLANIYLYDGATRLTDGASLNSDNTATFNSASGLFTVSGTKTISVVADVTGSDYSLGLTLTSVTSGGVVTPVNLAGNVQYVAVVSNAATVDFGTVTPNGGSIDPAKDVVVFNSNVSVGTRDVQFSRLALRQIGSVNNSDIANFRLMIDGTTVSTVANLDSNGYATFALATPMTLTTGNRVFKVLADVNGGSSRNFQFSVRSKTDVSFLDTQYNSGVAATFNSGGNFPATSASATSINSGSVTVQKTSDSTTGNVTLNGHDVVLARYNLTTYGESLKIEQVKAGFTYSNVGGGNGGGATLRNGRIMINGAQYGSTTTLVSAGTTFSTNYTLNAGTPTTLEIRADVYDNDGTGAIVATDTIKGTLMTLSNNTQRLSSLGYITFPASNVDGNTLTVQSAASLTMAKTSTYGNQITSTPQTSSYKLASYSLNGNNVEDVSLNNVNVDFSSVSGTTFTSANLTDVTLKINGNVIGSPKSTVSATGNSYSITQTLSKNGSMTIELWATISAVTNGTDSIRAVTTVTGTGASSSVSSTTGAVNGQTIASNTGSLTASLDASRPDAAMNDDSGTKTTAAFKFAAVTDSYTVTDLTFTVADTTTVSMMSLYDDRTLVASKAAAGTTTFNGLSWMIPAGQTKVLTVKLDLGTVGVGAGSTGAAVTVALTAGTATNGAGSSGAVSGLGSPVNGTAQYVFKAVPTLSTLALPTTALVAGTNTLSKFSVNANGTGTVAWNRIVFSLVKTAETTIANGAALTLWNADSNTQITGTAVIRQASDDAATCLGSDTTCRVTFVPSTEQQVSGATNYVLKATVGGTVAATDYISTSIQAPSAHAASDTYANVAASGSFANTYAGFGTTPSFVWSDVSASGHATTTADWNNDYLVRSLPLDSQTLTK